MKKISLNAYYSTIIEETEQQQWGGFMSYGNKREITYIFCHYAKNTLGFTSKEIGNYLNKQTRTVVSACLKYDEKYFKDKLFREKADFFKTRFKNIDGKLNEEPNKAKLIEVCKCVSEEKAEKLLKIILDYEKISDIIVKSEVIAHE
jgi:hypothetical protein